MNESQHGGLFGQLHQPWSRWRHHGHTGGVREVTHRELPAELPADQGPTVQRQDHKAEKEQDTNRPLKSLRHEWCRNLFSEVRRKHHHHHVPLPAGHRAPDSRAKSRGALAPAHLLPHHGQPPERLAPGRKAQWINDLCGSRWAVLGARRSWQAEGNGGKATALNLMVEISRATARSGRPDRSRVSTQIPRSRRHRWR